MSAGLFGDCILRTLPDHRRVRDLTVCGHIGVHYERDFSAAMQQVYSEASGCISVLANDAERCSLWSLAIRAQVLWDPCPYLYPFSSWVACFLC